MLAVSVSVTCLGFWNANFKYLAMGGNCCIMRWWEWTGRPNVIIIPCRSWILGYEDPILLPTSTIPPSGRTSVHSSCLLLPNPTSQRTVGCAICRRKARTVPRCSYSYGYRYITPASSRCVHWKHEVASSPSHGWIMPWYFQNLSCRIGKQWMNWLPQYYYSIYE